MGAKEGARQIGTGISDGVKGMSNGANNAVHNSGCSWNDIAKFVLAIFLPPLAVLMHKGQIDTDFWINLILTIIIYLPGILHAFYVLLCKSGSGEDFFASSGSPRQQAPASTGPENLSPLSSHAPARV